MRRSVCRAFSSGLLCLFCSNDSGAAVAADDVSAEESKSAGEEERNVAESSGEEEFSPAGSRGVPF